MRDISPAVAENIVTNVNTFLTQLGRYAGTPDQERDTEDSGLIRQVRIAAVSLMAAIETAGRLPAGPMGSGAAPAMATPAPMPMQPMTGSTRPPH